MEIAFQNGNGFAASSRTSSLSMVCDEEAFLRTLWLERRRTDRSGRPFLLLLLCLTDSRFENGDEIFSRALSALQDSTRETDILGWFQENKVLGCIFSELGSRSATEALQLLESKTRNCLGTALTARELGSFEVRWHGFPETSHSGKPYEDSNKVYVRLLEQIDSRRRPAARLLKRAMDVVITSCAFVALAPVFAACALAVKLSSPKDPVFFRQNRVGQYGKLFTFLKFRTMHAASDCTDHRTYVQQFIRGTAAEQAVESSDTGVYKLVADPRVTPVGRFLRRTSLDELPQFINVLKGEMSLVGPRPPLPYEFECYQAWHRRRILHVKPGITGLWQVTARSRSKFDDMVRLDLQYAKKWSLWLDLKILLQTPRAVFTGQGAY